MPTPKKNTKHTAAAPKIVPSNEPPIDNRSPAEITALAERTVNGIPVSELPPHVSNLITYAMTDQGIAEANGKRVDSQGRPHSGIQVTKNAGFDKTIDQRAAALEPWECTDPLKEAADKHGKPGFRYRGLSQRICDKKTLRGWQPVVVNGEPVKIGNLILGEMPEERAEKRNKHFRDIGNNTLAAAAEQLQVNQERLQRDAQSKGIDLGIAPLRANDVVTDHADPDRHVSIGVHTQRGLQGADAGL